MERRPTLTDDPTIRLTRRAAQKVFQLLAQRDLDPALALRLDVVGGAKSGLAYDLYFGIPEPGDRCFESKGIRIAIRPESLPSVVGSTVDWVDGDNGSGFQILNPNVPYQR